MGSVQVFDLPGEPVGSGTPGSGGFVPTLMSGGCSARGSTVVVSVVDGLGGAVGCLAGAASPASLPVWGGTIYVDEQFDVRTHCLLGFFGVPGTAGYMRAYAVPSDATPVGRTSWFQAGYRDSGAGFGVSLTSAATATVL